jgi:DNA-binding response OmpR family regulator
LAKVAVSYSRFPGPATPIPIIEEPARPTRILIVEDSAITATALRLLFESSGYEVVIAASVKEALQSGLNVIPEVMLLDLTLGDGDGLSVLQRLRDANCAPGATIALTGHDDDEMCQRCLDAGCTEVLIKPVPIARLLELVRSL